MSNSLEPKQQAGTSAAAPGASVQPLRPAPAAVAAAGPERERLRRVFVKDLVADCFLGIYGHEKGRRQRVRINLELAVPDHGPPPEDDIRHVVSYEHIAEGVRRLLAGPHVNLVETLAEKIAAFCLEDERVAWVRVRAEKLDVFADAESAGVEIERTHAGA